MKHLFLLWIIRLFWVTLSIAVGYWAGYLKGRKSIKK
jgi:hypothetical protein